MASGVVVLGVSRWIWVNMGQLRVLKGLLWPLRDGNGVLSAMFCLHNLTVTEVIAIDSLQQNMHPYAAIFVQSSYKFDSPLKPTQ